MVTARPSYYFVFGMGAEEAASALDLDDSVLQHTFIVVPSDLEDYVQNGLGLRCASRRGAIVFEASRGRRTLTCFNVDMLVFNDVQAMFKDVEYKLEVEEDKICSSLCLKMGNVR